MIKNNSLTKNYLKNILSELLVEDFSINHTETNNVNEWVNTITKNSYYGIELYFIFEKLESRVCSDFQIQKNKEIFSEDLWELDSILQNQKTTFNQLIDYIYSQLIKNYQFPEKPIE